MLYRIADLCVQMDCSPDGRTVRQAKPYLTKDGTPHIVMPPYPELIRQARLLYPGFTEEEQEYMMTGGWFYKELLRFDGMLLHASGLSMDGQGYVFTAPCGTGKSTHASLWQQEFGSRVTLLNDDKPALRLIDGQWHIYGTPWSGKTDHNTPSSAPLKGICLLKRDSENRICRISSAKALSGVLSQTLRPQEAPLMNALLTLLDNLLTSVPTYELGCTISGEAARTAYRGMTENDR